MKRFEFSLEELMGLREFREREAQYRLAEKTGRLNLLEQELLRIASERVRILGERFTGTRNILDYLADERYLSRLDRDRDRTERDIVRAELEREEALAAYNEALKQKKVLEKLREKEEEAWHDEYNRQEVNTLDDIAQGSAARLRYARGA